MTEKVNAGQSVNGLSSSVWNKMVDLSNSKKNINDINFEKNRGLILIKNTTDNVLPAFSVLQIDGTVTDQGSLPIDMKDVEIVFKGKVPEDDTIVNFCVTQEPLGQGEIGDAIVYGATKVHLTNDDEIDGDWNAALPRAGKTDAMKKSDGTGSQIVWVKDIEENGSRKAVVILNNISCPARPLPTQRYNVLKYYSMNRCFQSPSLDSEAPDYNNPQMPNLNRGIMVGRWNWQIREKGAPPATFAITDIATDNFLTIQNQRDIYNDQQKYTPVQIILSQTEYNSLTYYWDYDNPSIQHIEPNDEFREKNEEGFIEIDLYEKNASKTFKGVFESTPTAKEVDSMEWLFLHTKVFECQQGYVYIELSDISFEGNDSDAMISVIAWETTASKEASTTAQIFNYPSYFDNTETQEIYEQFYHFDNSNRVEQSVRISDLQGASSKKVVLNTNKFVSEGTEKYISVLIGLIPEDMDRSLMYPFTDQEIWDNSFPCPWNNCSYSNTTKISMKFSSAIIKIKDFGETVRTDPAFSPSRGVIDLYFNDYLQQNGSFFVVDRLCMINMNALIIDNSGNEWSGSGSHSGVMGFTNTQDSNVSNNPSYTPSPNVTLPDLTDYSDAISTLIFSSVPRSLKGLFVSRLRGLNPDNYTVRIPRFEAGLKGRSSYSGGQYDSSSGAAADLVLYIGENPQNALAGLGFKAKLFSEGLTEVARWTFNDINPSSRNIYPKDGVFNNGSKNKFGFDSVPVPNSDMDFISDFRYVDIDLSGYTSGQLYDMGLFLFVELNGRGIKNFSTPTINTTTNQVSSNGDNYDFAYIRPIPIYKDLVSSSFYNYGCMIFKKPQIINKEDTATAENYYA